MADGHDDRDTQILRHLRQGVVARPRLQLLQKLGQRHLGERVVEVEWLAGGIELLLASLLDALLLNAALADEVGGDATVGGQHDGAHVQSARALEHDRLQIRVPVEDLLVEGIGERVRGGLVASVGERLRQSEVRWESELGQALHLMGLLVDVRVAVVDDPGAGGELPFADRQGVGPGTAQDRGGTGDLPQEHPIVARPADDGEA